MRPRLSIPRCACAIAPLLLAAPPLRAHDEPILIGHTSATPPRLAFDGPADLFDGSEPIELQPGAGLFAGLWYHDAPGFATLDVDRPDIDLFPLLPGHAVALVLISAEPPLRFFEPIAFTPILRGPGSTFLFPHHPAGDFQINILSAMDSPGTCTGTFRFTDLSGLYLDSEPFTLTFQTVPTPTSVFVTMFAGLAALRRQRRRP